LRSYSRLIATELGNLNIELVCGCVPQGEAQGGRVCARAAHIYIGMVSCIGATYIGVVSIAAYCSYSGGGSPVSSLYRHNISRTLATSSLIIRRRCSGAIKDKALIVQPYTTNIIGTFPNSVLQGPSRGVVTWIVRVHYIGTILTNRGPSS